MARRDPGPDERDYADVGSADTGRRRGLFRALAVAAAAVLAVALVAGLMGLRAIDGGSEGPATLALAPDDAEVVALGRRIYAEHCAACHGANLEGEPDWRTRRADGRLPAPPHDPTGHTWHHPTDELFALTKYGVEAVVGGGYESDMPAYAGVLTDAEILAVLSYIKSTWPEPIRAAHDRRTRAATER